MQQVDILAFGAHPDDVELGCGGTLAKMISEGSTTGIIDLTRGELGTRGTPEIRENEAQKAADILGADFRKNLGFADGFFQNSKENQLEIIKLIREHQPRIILCNAPQDRHIDHGKGAQLVLDACFLSGLKKIDTGQNPWRPTYVFQYIQWMNLTPSFVVNIGNFIHTKVKACMAFESQFHNPNSNEPETAISSKNFTDSIKYRAQDLGRLIWRDYGEGFICQSTLAVDDLNAFI